MTTEEVTTQAQAQAAFDTEGKIKDALNAGRKALWQAAEHLHAFDEQRGWLHLGYESRPAWLADSEVTLTSATYSRLVRTWRKLVVERKIDPDRLRQLDQSKVQIVTSSIVENKVPIDEALADVESCGAQDLREKYLGAAPRPTLGDSNVGTNGDKPDPAKTPKAPSGRKPEGPALTVEALVKLAQKRWHRAPDEESVTKYLTEQLGEKPGKTIAVATETTTTSADALAEADQLPWDDLADAAESGAEFPRIERRHVEAFLAWHEKFLA